MRKFNRPSVDCANCNAKIYSSLTWRTHSDENAVDANWEEPPQTSEKCPKCNADVDTTNAYPFIPTFPPKFEHLREAYEGFAPKWEHRRGSFENMVGKYLSDGRNLEQCQSELNTP
jgi:hypothetical protein